jgi:heptosyltransferase II
VVESQLKRTDAIIMDMPMVHCRYFNGYKPCGKSENCDSVCAHLSVPSCRILVIHLEALGAVLRSTALLPAIHRKYPGCHVTWVTQKPADQLLLNNPLIDRVITTEGDDLLRLSALEFDIALVVDKGLKSAGVLKRTSADLVYGFVVDPINGAVMPATEAASELWKIGLSDQKKFYENRKAETQLAHEALELGPWRRDDYVLKLTEKEQAEVRQRKNSWSGGGQFVVGINTGCSGIIPYKKLSIATHRRLIAELQRDPRLKVVLLGGREDALSNQRIGHGLDVVQTATDKGLRDGLISVAACDVVVSGDSLGMHMAIALRKWTVAWFGPTCAHEIDLYGRGVHVLTQAPCSPCWKRSCHRTPMCHELVSIDELVRAVKQGLDSLALECGLVRNTKNRTSDHSNGLPG